MINIEFDSLIYSLQNFGGASVYWKQIVSRVSKSGRFKVVEHQPSRVMRGVPVFSSADIFHSSHFRLCVNPGVKVVSTVHDMTYELGLVSKSIASKINIKERKYSYFTSDALICISDNTKNDLIKIYPELVSRCPIYVVYHGFFAPESSSLTRKLGVNFGLKYALYIGARRAYKNFKTALLGFHSSEIWKEGYKLVCTGSKFEEDEFSEIEKLGLRNSVISLGRVSQADLHELYSGAHCLLYTSVYEGFGLPLLEAMSCGCPVVASGASCVPEIVGDAGILVSPFSVEETSYAINVLFDAAERNRIVERGYSRIEMFSWERSAKQHMQIYEDLVR